MREDNDATAITTVMVDAPNTIEALVDAAAVDLDDDLVLRLIYDIAHRIHTWETIGNRYGLGGELGLRKFLAAHPRIVEQARRLRTIVDSDASAQDRARLKATHATEELIVPMAIIAGDPRVPAGQRIDAFKQLNRVAGVDGMPASAKENPGREGNQFVVNFNFATAPPEKIATTVVDALPAP